MVKQSIFGCFKNTTSHILIRHLSRRACNLLLHMPQGFARHIHTLAKLAQAVHPVCRHNNTSTMQHVGSSALQSMRTGALPAPAHGLSGVRTMLCPHTQRLFGGVLTPAVQQVAALGGAHGIHQSRIIAQAAAVAEGWWCMLGHDWAWWKKLCSCIQHSHLQHTHSSSYYWHQSA